MQNDISANLAKWDSISRYSEWMYHTYEKYIGKKVFDVGAGLGRMAQFYVDRCEKAVATDIFPEQVDFMNERFRDKKQFQAVLLDITQDDIKTYQNSFDTVVCINVLEHIEDDLMAVAAMKSLLIEGGRLIIFVPALQSLYCAFDRNVSHYRRYERGRLKRLAEANEMTVLKNIYFNFMGIFPYYWKGKKKNVSANESFSSNLDEKNSKLFNFATAILEPIERTIAPPIGISELIVMQK